MGQLAPLPGFDWHTDLLGGLMVPGLGITAYGRQPQPALFGMRAQSASPGFLGKPVPDSFRRSGPRVTFGSYSIHFGGVRRKVMTYNAANLNDSKSYEAKSALGQAIRQEDPDIIALQEVGYSRKQLKSFNRNFLRGLYPVVVMPEQPTASIGRQAFLCKRGIQVSDVQSHFDQQNPGAPESPRRGFIEATFRTDTGYQFRLFNAHFRAKRPDKDIAQAIRLEEARTASELLKAILKRNPQERLLVVGDFNSKPVRRPGDEEILDTLSLKNDAPRGKALTETVNHIQARGGTFQETISTGRRVDRMFASSALLRDVVNAYVAGNISQLPWKNGSDHLPVVTELEEPDELAQPAVSSSQPPRFRGGFSRVA